MIFGQFKWIISNCLVWLDSLTHSGKYFHRKSTNFSKKFPLLSGKPAHNHSINFTFVNRGHLLHKAFDVLALCNVFILVSIVARKIAGFHCAFQCILLFLCILVWVGVLSEWIFIIWIFTNVVFNFFLYQWNSWGAHPIEPIIMNKMFWNILSDHVFRFLLNLLIIPLHNTCSEILNLLLLSLKQHALVFVLGTRSSLCWLCYCFCIFISLCRLHRLWLLGCLCLDKNRFYFYTIPLPF
jgi:hypothetical protein